MIEVPGAGIPVYAATGSGQCWDVRVPVENKARSVIRFENSRSNLQESGAAIACPTFATGM